jgi:cyanophycinase
LVHKAAGAASITSLRAVWNAAAVVSFGLAALVGGAGRAADLDDELKVVEPRRGEPIPGALFICGGGRLPEAALGKFVDLAGGEQARLVLITTASETADSPEVEPRIYPFRQLKVSDLKLLHTRSRETANAPEFCRPLEQATGVWIIGGHQHRLTDAYLDTRVEKALRGVLERGGIIGGTSAGAAVMSEVMIKGGNPEPELGRGFGLLPGTLIDQHFLKRRRQDRLIAATAGFPQLVGLGIDEGTILLVRGRKLTVLPESESQVVAVFGPCKEMPAKTEVLPAGAEADLLALSRAAAKRVKPRVDAHNVRPMLPKGTLVLVGGGNVPEEAASRFVAAAGGAEALIVVITTAHGDDPPEDDAELEWLTAAGAARITRLHVRNCSEAADPNLAKVLKKAGGVWFVGGRQWRLVDAFLDTPVESLLGELLTRDGVIGGNAAGASILASYLVRGSPLSNSQIMADGYDDGFGFLRGAAVDPYFSQRNRHADMKVLKRARPQLLGLGIDEGTAVVVRGRELEVFGRHRVAVFDAEEVDGSQRGYKVLLAGDRYDLHEKERVGSTRGDTDEPETLASQSEAADAEIDSEASPPVVCE